MNNYLDISYWFALYPSAWDLSGRIFIITALACFLLGLVIKIILFFKNNKGVIRKTLNKLSNFLLTLSLLGVFYWFMRQQLVPFFSSRFWLLIILLTAITWLVFIVLYFIRRSKEEKINLERTALYGKYLPGQK